MKDEEVELLAEKLIDGLIKKAMSMSDLQDLLRIRGILNKAIEKSRKVEKGLRLKV